MKELVLLCLLCFLKEVCMAFSCFETQSTVKVTDICSNNVVTHTREVLLRVTQLEECQCILSMPNVTRVMYIRLDDYSNTGPPNVNCGVKVTFNTSDVNNGKNEYDCDVFPLTFYLYSGTDILISTKLRPGYLHENEGYCIRIQNVYSYVPSSLVLKCTHFETSESIVEKDVQKPAPYVYVLVPVILIILLLIPLTIFLYRKGKFNKYGFNHNSHHTNGNANPIYDELENDTAIYVVTTYDNLSAEENSSGTTNPNYTNLDINGLNSKSDIGGKSCKSLDGNGSSLETITERDKDNCSVHNYMDIELDEQYETFEKTQDQTISTSTKETDCYFESMVFNHGDNVKQDRSVEVEYEAFEN